MDKTTLITQLADYLQRKAQDDSQKLTPDTPLLDDWLGTSMEVIDMVLFLEKQFAIKMRDSDISAENFDTLNALADFVLAKLAG